MNVDTVTLAGHEVGNIRSMLWIQLRRQASNVIEEAELAEL